MADPARAPKMTFTERRKQAEKSCPCQRVADILSGVRVRYPKCVRCLFETQIRETLKGV